MTRDVRQELSDLVQQAIEEAIADPEVAPARVDRLLPPGSVPALEGWPSPSLHARVRAQIIVCHAVATIEALDPEVRRDVVYTGLNELPQVGYSFKSCSDGDDLVPAPLVVHCLAAEAGHVLAKLIAHRFTPVYARPEPDDQEGHLLAGDVRRAIARRLNSLVLVESNLWYLASLGDTDLVVPYAVRYDLARFMWDREQPGHVLCLRCGSHVHYRRPARYGTPRHARCRPCSRGNPDAWPSHASEPHTRGTWWLRCQAQDCTHIFVGRADQLRCPHCRLDTTTLSRRKPLVRDR